jgi:hypothetical protein
MLLASLTVFTISISQVHASMIAFKFEGELTQVDSTLSDTFSTGERFSGTYTFDDETPYDESLIHGSIPSADFSNAISKMSFSSGNYNASATNGKISQVFNDGDRYFASFEPVSGSAVRDFVPDEINVFWRGIGLGNPDVLIDSPGYEPLINVFNWDPFGAPPLFDAQGNPARTFDEPLFDAEGNPVDPIRENGNFDFSFINDDQQAVSIEGKLTSVNVVPIPAAVWLFGSGLLGLIGFTKSKSKKYL